jgi:hypothetical protein
MQTQFFSRYFNKALLCISFCKPKHLYVLTKILSVQLISKVFLFHLYCKHSQTCMFRVPESFEYLSKMRDFSNLRLYSKEHCNLINNLGHASIIHCFFFIFSNAVMHSEYLQCIGRNVQDTVFAETFFFSLLQIFKESLPGEAQKRILCFCDIHPALVTI